MSGESGADTFVAAAGDENCFGGHVGCDGCLVAGDGVEWGKVGCKWSVGWMLGWGGWFGGSLRN